MSVDHEPTPNAGPLSRIRPVAYRVEPSRSDNDSSARDRDCLYVVDGGSHHGWSIRLGGVTSPTIMNREGLFRFDDKTDLRRWRFPLPQALDIAEQHVNNLDLLCQADLRPAGEREANHEGVL